MTAIDENKPHGSDFPWGFGSVRFYTSHSDLWASHHAGKLGSFGERVGRTCFKKRAAAIFMLKVSITPAAVPKRINFTPVSLPRGRNSPEYWKSGSIAVNAVASVLTQFNWPYFCAFFNVSLMKSWKIFHEQNITAEKPFQRNGALLYSHVGSIVRPAELHSPSAEENCMTENVASLCSVKVAAPPCAAKATIPCVLAAAKRF